MSKPGTKRTFLKDLQDLYRKIESSTDGQARVVSASDFVIVINLRPNSGYNAHASFDFTVRFLYILRYLDPLWDSLEAIADQIEL